MSQRRPDKPIERVMSSYLQLYSWEGSYDCVLTAILYQSNSHYEVLSDTDIYGERSKTQGILPWLIMAKKASVCGFGTHNRLALH